MRKSQICTIMDFDRIKNSEYISICRNGHDNAFIRNRKMPLDDLLLTMLNRKGLTLALELRNYMNDAHSGQEISKLGYLKQRMKLNLDAFLDLYHHHNKNFYAGSDFNTYKGICVQLTKLEYYVKLNT